MNDLKARITRAQAEAVLAAVKTKYAAYIGDDDRYGPKLEEDWDWIGGHPTPFAVVWEEGPYEWAIRFGGGGFNYETYDAVLAYTGDSERATQAATEEPTPAPDGVFMEPVTSWALGLYPA